MIVLAEKQIHSLKGLGWKHNAQSTRAKSRITVAQIKSRLGKNPIRSQYMLDK